MVWKCSRSTLVMSTPNRVVDARNDLEGVNGVQADVAAEQLGIVVQHVFGDAQVLADHVLDLLCNFSLRHGDLSPYDSKITWYLWYSEIVRNISMFREADDAAVFLIHADAAVAAVALLEQLLR